MRTSRASIFQQVGRTGLLQFAIVFGLGGWGCASNGNDPNESNTGSSGSSRSGGSPKGMGGSGSNSSGDLGSNPGSGSSGSSGGSGGGSGSGAGSSGTVASGDDGGASGDDGSTVMNSGDGGGSIPHGACLDGITNYEQDGPFMVKTTMMGSVNFWVPSVPSGLQGPRDPSVERHRRHVLRLRRRPSTGLATHGFLACCYERHEYRVRAGRRAGARLRRSWRIPTSPTTSSAPPGTPRAVRRPSPSLQLAEQKYGDDV